MLALPVTLEDGRVQTLPLLVYEALLPTVQGRQPVAEADWLAWFARQGRQHPGTVFVLNTEAAEATGFRKP